MKNNFMEKKERDNSLFSKFKKYKDSEPKLNNVTDNKPPRGKRDTSNDKIRAKQAAKVLAKQKKEVLNYEEERKQALDKKAKMDQIRKKYTNYSRSRSRKRSSSNGPKSCITNLNKNPAQSEIQVKSKLPPKGRNKVGNRVKDNRTEISHGRLRQGKFRKLSPDDTTKCTREEDFNIDQFLMDDLAYINKEEAKLQQEILLEHKNTVMKVKEVEMKHQIDTKMVQAKQIVKQLNDLDPYETMNKFDFNKETEDQIEESLENLNYLLAQNKKSDKEKKKAYKKLANKMNIRLDSTSPVRNVPVNQQQCKGYNPFAYEAQINYNEVQEAPTFKPRSVINDNKELVSNVGAPKSVVTTASNKVGQNRGRQNNGLLDKNQQCKGSYLNAESLKKIEKPKNNASNTPQLGYNLTPEKEEEESFSNYQHIAEEIKGREQIPASNRLPEKLPVGGGAASLRLLKQRMRNPSANRYQSRSKSNNRKGNGSDDDYEDDFDDVSDNEPEHKVIVNPKFNIKSIL